MAELAVLDMALLAVCLTFDHSSCMRFPSIYSLCHFCRTTLLPLLFWILLVVGGASYVVGRTAYVDVAHSK